MGEGDGTHKQSEEDEGCKRHIRSTICFVVCNLFGRVVLEGDELDGKTQNGGAGGGNTMGAKGGGARP